MHFSFNVNPGFAQIVGYFQSKVKKQEKFFFNDVVILQSNLRTTAMHGDEPFGLCREFDLISEFF